jgi:nicotinate phosphoribosyltransferase
LTQSISWLLIYGEEMYSHSLLTDFYELTMAAGYFDQVKLSDTAVFELYFRNNPFNGGYSIAAGLETAIGAILDCRFENDDLGFLESQRTPEGTPVFNQEFLRYLASYRFSGDIFAIPEGTVVFPNEPLVQVRGNLIECQLIESLLLCHINFQTLIATKAARIWDCSNQGSIIDFGLRRAQGPDGSLSASRAAYIGGAEGTSNVLAAARLGIPAKGTHAHSWIQSFSSELEAFRAFAATFPDACILLVDTYDTLGSGMPHAVTVARELEKEGHRLLGIRIDSGDLARLSRKAREILDGASMPYVKIVASNDLDEYAISEIITRGGRVDIWGVGTRLITGSGEGGSALGGVYKLVEHNGAPKVKLSSEPGKATFPGRKKIVRFCARNGRLEADVLAGSEEDLSSGEVVVLGPHDPLGRECLRSPHREELLLPVMQKGSLVYAFPGLAQVQERRKEQMERLPQVYRQIRNSGKFNVSLTEKLWNTRKEMLP